MLFASVEVAIGGGDGAGEAVVCGVVAPELMRSSRTQDCAAIAAFGYRPPYWDLDIIESNVMERSMRSWPTNSADLVR